ncbi:restriction endonuclease subunit S [uncultured Megasphaera sp.]|uniref:restriction endonuclease subunit S n=1 Tax=uncultured Megasphaera sp. TaxID=165188 RepID=UPI00260379BA|nr:restriction endonuclease subunit S [uncultured Megasphaera sp.]
MVRLGEVAEIVSGYNVARLPATDQDKKYTNADFEHDFYQMKLATLTNDIIYRQSLSDRNMSATIISDENKDKFISQVFSIMKVDTAKVNLRYLCFLLNESDIVNRQCSILLQGSVITRLSAHQLKKIEIPLIPLSEQKKLGRLYVTALYHYYLEVTVAKMKLQGIRSILHDQEHH